MRLVRLLLMLSLLLAPSLGVAQSNGFYTDRAVGTSQFNGFTGLVPIPYGQVRVCTYPAIGSPCSPVAQVYDLNGNPLAINGGNFGQVTTDVVGRFNFQAPPGNYQIQVAAGSSNTPQLNYTVTIGVSALTGTIVLNSLSVKNLEGTLYADQFDPTDFCNGVQLAHNALPSTGGTVDASGYGAAPPCASPVNQTKKLHVIVGASTVGATCGMFNVGNDLVVEGINRGASKLLGGSFCPVFNATNATGAIVKQFILKNVTCEGSDASTDCLVVPNWVAGGPQWDNAQITFENDVVEGFTSWAVTLGQSVYWMHTIDSHFRDNGGSILNMWASDFDVTNSQFEEPNHTVQNAHIKTSGGSRFSITQSDFERNDANPVGDWQAADIELDACPVGGDHGYGEIAWNKFGGEGGSPTRVKILNYCATNTGSVTIGVDISMNKFICDSSTTPQTVIRLTNGIDRWHIGDNFWSSCTNWVDDIQPLTISNAANSDFDAQQHFDLGGRNPNHGNTGFNTMFTNGGRGFKRITREYTNPQFALPDSYQIPYLNNRIQGNSESFATGWIPNSVTVTTGVADPNGTTKAVTLTKAAGNINFNIGVALDKTKVTGGLPFTHAVMQFWCQAGTYTRITVGILDLSTSAFQVVPSFDCPADWAYFAYPIYGLDPTHNVELVVYPGTNGDSTGGTVNFAFPQVSDYGGKYIATTGVAASTLFGDVTLGSVGIGNTAPGKKLDVTGDIRASASIIAATGAIGGGSTFSFITKVVDTPGAITVNAATCTDRSIAVTGLTTGASIFIGAGYALEANLAVGSGQAAAGTAHYRICNPTAGNITLAAGSTFNVWIIQ